MTRAGTHTPMPRRSCASGTREARSKPKSSTVGRATWSHDGDVRAPRVHPQRLDRGRPVNDADLDTRGEANSEDPKCLRLDTETRRLAALRLKSANGHLEGIVRMLEDENVYCVDVLKQVKAVKGALAKINAAVLRAHIRANVATAAQRGDADAVVDELVEALKYRA